MSSHAWPGWVDRGARASCVLAMQRGTEVPTVDEGDGDHSDQLHLLGQGRQGLREKKVDKYHGGATRRMFFYK